MSAQDHDEELWIAARSCMFPPSSFAAGPGEVAACLALAGTPRGADVLDLACGPGRHSLPLARAGYSVVGVDRTRAYLDELRAQLDGEGSRRGRPMDAELVHGDMREFCRPGCFDLALSLYHSLGYFKEEGDNRRVLGNLFACLRPAGVLVAQLVAKESLQRDFQASSEVQLEDGTSLLQERRPDDDWTWMEVSWTFVRSGERRSFDLSHRIYSAERLEEELLAAGFQSVALHGGFDGRPYDGMADKLVAVARRCSESGEGQIA